jgi:DNA-directed RNA polymerase subunit RPC12/RpoP
VGGGPVTAPVSKTVAAHVAISRVPCPACGARILAPYRAPNGSLAVVPHQARRRVAADAGLYIPGGA